MRKDELDQPCPETLGEYRDIMVALFGADNKAVAYLDEKIVEQGRDEKVLAADSQMRQLLFGMLR